MNLPNAITLFRLLLTAIFIAAVTTKTPSGNLIALVSFVLAAVSDWADGYLARKLNLVTSLGKLLDPLADKILVAAGFIFLTASTGPDNKPFCPIWVTCVIIGREFMVTGLRQIAVEKGQVIAADRLGKWKTTFQLIFIIGCLTHNSFAPLEGKNILVSSLQFLSNPKHYIVPISLWGATALTVISGWNYLWNGRNLLKDN